MIKSCSKCKESKPLSKFPRSSRNRERFDSWCKSCRAAASALRCISNPEAVKASQATWRKKNAAAWRGANREKVREAQKRYREQNKEKVNAANRRWRANNLGQVLQLERKWRATDQVRTYQYAYCRQRQARKRKAVPIWANSENISAIYAEARRRRLVGEDVHVDHIVPLKSDFVCGLHWEGNLQILPAKANIRKRNYMWPDMSQSLSA